MEEVTDLDEEEEEQITDLDEEEEEQNSCQTLSH
jgi:hypothetical protein